MQSPEEPRVWTLRAGLTLSTLAARLCQENLRWNIGVGATIYMNMSTRMDSSCPIRISRSHSRTCHLHHRQWFRRRPRTVVLALVSTTTSASARALTSIANGTLNVTGRSNSSSSMIERWNANARPNAQSSFVTAWPSRNRRRRRSGPSKKLVPVLGGCPALVLPGLPYGRVEAGTRHSLPRPRPMTMNVLRGPPLMCPTCSVSSATRPSKRTNVMALAIGCR